MVTLNSSKARYTTLHRLEREGLIEGKWERIPNWQERRYYCLSLLGRDGAEAKWIAASELERQLREDLGDGHLSRHVARRIGYRVRTLGLLTHARSKKRTSTGVMYYIQPRHPVNVRDNWGNEALPDATSEGTEPAGAAGFGRRHGLKRRNHAD